MNVCKNCFSDKELKVFIETMNTTGKCNFCNTPDISVIDIKELLEFFKELLDNFQKKENGKGLISELGTWGLFSHPQEGTKILNYVINEITTHILNANDSVDYIDDILDNVSYWETLKNKLKWESRYFTDINKLEELRWDSYFNSQISINKHDVFYHQDFRPRPFQSPVKFRIRAGRMSSQAPAKLSCADAPANASQAVLGS